MCWSSVPPRIEPAKYIFIDTPGYSRKFPATNTGLQKQRVTKVNYSLPRRGLCCRTLLADGALPSRSPGLTWWWNSLASSSPNVLK